MRISLAELAGMTPDERDKALARLVAAARKPRTAAQQAHLDAAFKRMADDCRGGNGD